MGEDKLVRSLRLQLRLERTAIALIALFFLVRWAYGNFQARPYAIFADGKPIACLATAEAAERVLAQIKGAVSVVKPSEVSFRERVTIGRTSRGAKVQSEAEATKAALGKLTLRVMKHAVLVDGVPVAAVDSEEQAGAVLEAAKEKYGSMARDLMEEPQFKQDVKAEKMAVDLALYRPTVEEALDALLSGGGGGAGGGSGVCVVTSGDVAGKIAQDHRMTLSELQALNPGRNLDKLQIGDQLKVSKGTGPGKPRLTVVVRSRESKTERIPYQTETVSSVRLHTGQQTELSPGSDGLRQVVLAATYENGIRTGSEVVEETIVRNSVPRRVAIGIR